MSSIFNALFRSVSNSATPAPAPPPSQTPTRPSPAKDSPLPAPAPPDQHRPRNVSEPIVQKATPAHRNVTSIDSQYPPSPFSAAHGHPSASDHSPMGHGNLVDLSYDITSSSISEPSDILFPRGIPFVYRRRHAQAGTDGAPIQAPPSFYQPSPSGKGQSIVIRDPLDLPPPKSENTKPPQLTEWRKEQLRRQNPARLIEPVEPKTIPALHGPPNLPYARNTTGVDSCMADGNQAFHPYLANQAKRINPQNFSNLHVQQNPTFRPPTRFPYQQHVETADLIQGDGGYYKRAGPALPMGLLAATSAMHDPRPTPSEVLRAQLHTLPPTRAIGPITEQPSRPIRSIPGTQPVYLDISKVRTPPLNAPESPDAQRIVDDVDTYSTAPRYVAESNMKAPKLEASTAKALSEEESAAAAKTLASSKADASVNWRLKTPAKGAASGLRAASLGRYTPSGDRSDDAPTMTIDSLFEKFAPTTGSNPITITVNTPSQIDPAVKEVSKTPFLKTNPASRHLRAPSPELSVVLQTPAANASLSASEAFVEDLISLDSEPDENTAPEPPAVVRKLPKYKGTPDAGKLLKRTRGTKVTASRDEGVTLPATGVLPKIKAPLGMAKTVTSSAKGKAA